VVIQWGWKSSRRMTGSWKVVSGSGGCGRRWDVGRKGSDRAVWWRVLAIDDRHSSHSLRGGGGVRHVGRFQLGSQLAFPLVATVLEPDLDLRLVEAERGGDLDAARAGQVPVEVELLLEFGQLLVGEVGSAEVRRRLQRLAMSETVVREMRQLVVPRVDV